MAFRLVVSIDGRPDHFAANYMSLVRMDQPSSRDLAPGHVAGGSSAVNTLGPKKEGWYSVALLPGRYYLSAIAAWRFPTPRALPSLVIEIPSGDTVAYAGSIELNCHDRPPASDPKSRLYDCAPPKIRTDEAGTAARLLGDPTLDPAIRAMAPLSSLTSPVLGARPGPWVLEPIAATDALLGRFRESERGAGDRAAEALSVAAEAAACGPLFPFCAMLTVPTAAIGAAVDAGVETHKKKITRACNERLKHEVEEFDADKRLRTGLRERLAASGWPLSDPVEAPGATAPALVLRLAVLRIGVRGDTCLPGFAPFQASDRYQADILAFVQAIDGASGVLLYEEILGNAEKLSSWDVVAGRAVVTPVGGEADCHGMKKFCNKAGKPLLASELEPAIDAFADHVVRTLTQSAKLDAAEP